MFMLLIDESNAERYLRDSRRLAVGDVVEVVRLSGGVSNEVLYIGFSREPARDFVLKQAREQLRVADPWFCGVDRIWREVEVLRICDRVLAEKRKNAGSGPPLLARTPRILFEDRGNYCFGMEAAPREHWVWKRQLLAGEPDTAIAEQCGRLLGTLHAGTWGDAEVAAALDDRRIFDELRIDPYYRTVAGRHPQAARLLNGLVESVWRRRLCLVHADFSPKNLLVYPGGLMMVDFETGHYGDPAFDLGFFLTHLVLKAFYQAPRHEPMLELTEQFWTAHRETMAHHVGHVSNVRIDAAALAELERHAILNFAGCAWARLDGKSPVEYLTDAARRDQVRSLCRWALEQAPATWDEVLAKCRTVLS